MDAAVRLAMEKWPDVPAAHGWLRLTARGEWLLDGGPIVNQPLREFIGRNYEHDEAGHWFFQNGPQRVTVELEATPWIWRLHDGVLVAHTGARPCELREALLVDGEHIALVTELGCGQLDDREVASFIALLADRNGMPLAEGGLERWLEGREEVFIAPAALGLTGAPRCLDRCSPAELPVRYHFVREPLPG